MGMVDNLKSQLITPYLTCQPLGLAANNCEVLLQRKSLVLQLVLLMLTGLSAHHPLVSAPHFS